MAEIDFEPKKVLKQSRLPHLNKEITTLFGAQ